MLLFGVLYSAILLGQAAPDSVNFNRRLTQRRHITTVAHVTHQLTAVLECGLVNRQLMLTLPDVTVPWYLVHSRSDNSRASNLDTYPALAVPERLLH